MTADEAIAVVHARWSGPPLDARDVEERLAVREHERVGPTRFLVLPCAPAVRLFVRGGRHEWTSAYLHELGEIARLLDRLEASARGAS